MGSSPPILLNISFLKNQEYISMYREATYNDYLHAPKNKESFINKEQVLDLPRGRLFLLNNKIEEY